MIRALPFLHSVPADPPFHRDSQSPSIVGNASAPFFKSVQFVACVLPSWYWCTGRVMGLPIYPIFGMSFIPTYVTPLWQGHERLDKFTFNEINLAVWTVAGFLLWGYRDWEKIGRASCRERVYVLV